MYHKSTSCFLIHSVHKETMSHHKSTSCFLIHSVHKETKSHHKNDLLPGLRYATTGVSFVGMKIQNSLEVLGMSLFPWSSMYLLIWPSFKPMVEEKYPTLQMPSFSI